MITLLHIKNIGIIDDLEIHLNHGLNVLTGETGAGKTLIIGALKILSGSRFSKEMIRAGEKNSFVEMSICLPGEEENVIVSREINGSGKNICKINGRLVTVAELKNFMGNIIDIHGQNDNQSILDLNKHISLLDGYAQTKLENLQEEYGNLYEQYLQIKKELKLNFGDDREKQRQLDLLNYQFDEISQAELKETEEDELEERRKLMMASEKIADSIHEAQEEIDNHAVDALNQSIRSLERIEQYQESYAAIVARLKSCYYEIQEAARDLASEEVSFDAEEMNQIEERLDLIKSLKRKYGSTVTEILEYQQQVEKEIFAIENAEKYVAELKEKKMNIENKMLKLSERMHEIRIEHAEKLSQEITLQLKELEMKNAEFEVRVEWQEDKKFSKNGLDKVEFLIATNRGDEKKPLIKIASGGEMSRVMLAIKTVLADIDQTPILVFDEIDTGISGNAANKTGEKMQKIGEHHQVICVTHLATIAAKGDFNYYIYKESDENKTRTYVKQLDEEGTIREIARIANGDVNDISLQNAKQLRKKSQKIA